MIPEIYDNTKTEGKEGIDLVLNMENGLSLTIYMDDNAARDLVDIIDNKLIARGK